MILKYVKKIIFLLLVVEISYVFINFYAILDKIRFDLLKNEIFGPGRDEIEMKNVNKRIIDDSIIIKKIGVDAPIVFNSGITESEILSNLDKGVVFYSSSSLPDEDGISIYLGHSSNYWWKNSFFNTVFSLLPELEAGNEILINYNGESYVYVVFEKKIIKPDQWQELENKKISPGLALVTCWPLGTAFQRLVIFAKRAN